MNHVGRSEEGQTLIYVAVAMVALLGLAALAIDGGHLYAERRAMQNAADAGALAGARELCRGIPEATAEAVARDYAVNRNQAAWATPAASGKTLSVNALEPVNLLFGGIGGIVPVSMTVSASAQARCERTNSACTTWPISVKQSQWEDKTKLSCGDTIYITVEHDDDCPSGCDCSHVFSGVTDPQRGWIVRPNDSCGNAGGITTFRDALYNGGYSDWQIRVGDCMRGKPGTSTGAFGGANGTDLENWRIANGGAPTVRIPLFSSYAAGDCGGGGDLNCKSYTVGGFGCFDVTGWEKNKVAVPALPGKTCKLDISKVIVARVRCDSCPISCGSAGGAPNPTDALVPVLVP
jgi:hypothetical protein